MDESLRGAVPGGWHTYRCPVCGHTDELEFAAGPAGTVPCSHCGTALEVALRAPDQASVTVKVAARWRRAR